MLGTQVAEGDSGDHPDALSGNEAERDERFFGNPESGDEESNLAAAVVAGPANRAVFKRKDGRPPVAAVASGNNGDFCFRTVLKSQFHSSDGFPGCGNPCGGVEEIEIASSLRSGELYGSGAGKTAETGEHKTGASAVCLRVDDFKRDSGEIALPEFGHAGEVVCRPLIGPSAFSVIRLSVGESHIGCGGDGNGVRGERFPADGDIHVEAGFPVGFRHMKSDAVEILFG